MNYSTTKKSQFEKSSDNGISINKAELVIVSS